MKRWSCLDFARPLKRALWGPGPKADEIPVRAESDVPFLDRTSFPFAGQPSVQHCSDRVDLLSYCQIAGQEPYLVLPPGAGCLPTTWYKSIRITKYDIEPFSLLCRVCRQ